MQVQGGPVFRVTSGQFRAWCAALGVLRVVLDEVEIRADTRTEHGHIRGYEQVAGNPGGQQVVELDAYRSILGGGDQRSQVVRFGYTEE